MVWGSAFFRGLRLDMLDPDTGFNRIKPRHSQRLIKLGLAKARVSKLFLSKSFLGLNPSLWLKSSINEAVKIKKKLISELC